MRSRYLGLAAFLLIATSISTVMGSVTRFREAASLPSPHDQQQSSIGQESSDPAKLEVEVVKLYKEGKYDEAVPLAKRVLKIREAQLPANDPLLADSMGNLAMLYLAKGKFDDAASLLKQALSIYEQNPDKNAVVLAKTLDSLGHVRLFKAEVKKAEEFYLRALSIKQNSLNPDHDEILYSLNNLQDLYVKHKGYGKASEMLRRIITIKERKLGDSDTQVGRLIERMACLMYRNKETAEAEKVEARANHILYGDLATRPEPIQLPREVFTCKLVDNPRPDFVSVARGRGFPGRIAMDVAVETDESGNVTAAHLVGGDPAYKSVAESAARGAKLRPTIVDGRPVKVEGVISHEFMTMTRTVMVAVPGSMPMPGPVVRRP